MARKGISLQSESKPLGKMNQPEEDNGEAADNRPGPPEQTLAQAAVVYSNGHKAVQAKTTETWPEFWKELAGLPNGAALRKKGIEVRSSIPEISIAELRARLK